MCLMIWYLHGLEKSRKTDFVRILHQNLELSGICRIFVAKNM